MSENHAAGKNAAVETYWDAMRQWLVERQALIGHLYTNADAARWGISKEKYCEALARSAAQRFSAGRPAGDEIEAYLRSLHLKDLALACACAEGLEKAWEYFFAAFRNYLYTAAAAVMRLSSSDPRARELADALYGELFSAGRAKERRPLFCYFHGRSKLETWLRVLLAQRYVDGIRMSKKFGPMEDAEAMPSHARSLFGRNDLPKDPYRERYLALLHKAFDRTLASLDEHDRARLSLYYTEGKTLAQIGVHLDEHESTVSRNLDRIRRTLRKKTESILRVGEPAGDGQEAKPGLTDEQIRLCFEYALEDWPFDLRRALAGTGSPDAEEKRS
jgi:RNA polymerase sigma-70 factor